MTETDLEEMADMFVGHGKGAKDWTRPMAIFALESLARVNQIIVDRIEFECLDLLYGFMAYVKPGNWYRFFLEHNIPFAAPNDGENLLPVLYAHRGSLSQQRAFLRRVVREVGDFRQAWSFRNNRFMVVKGRMKTWEQHPYLGD